MRQIQVSKELQGYRRRKISGSDRLYWISEKKSELKFDIYFSKSLMLKNLSAKFLLFDLISLKKFHAKTNM